MPGEPFLTSGQVAERLGVTSRAVARWVQKGMLKPTLTTPGGRYRWKWSDVERQLREQRQRDE
ncbi:MAG: helix-turn-helix domain-containing protein [Pseudonocardiaceae bacterium]|nr:helix-turn-helix domain-containing protein [Actinomycetota bacterium]